MKPLYAVAEGERLVDRDWTVDECLAALVDAKQFQAGIAVHPKPVWLTLLLKECGGLGVSSACNIVYEKAALCFAKHLRLEVYVSGAHAAIAYSPDDAIAVTFTEKGLAWDGKHFKVSRNEVLTTQFPKERFDDDTLAGVKASGFQVRLSGYLVTIEGPPDKWISVMGRIYVGHHSVLGRVRAR